MSRRFFWCCACIGFSPGALSAQETVTFDIRFADPVLTPGESQHIEVWAILEPGPGAKAIWNTNGGSGQVGTVGGIGAATFHFTNVVNGSSGSFSGLALNPQFLGPVAGQNPGVPDGEGNVHGIQFVEIPLLGSFHWLSPMLLWSCLWTPNEYSARMVEFTTQVVYGPEVYLAIGTSIQAFPDTWKALNPSASFEVVPAPMAALPVAAGAIAIARRRRRDGTP